VCLHVCARGSGQSQGTESPELLVSEDLSFHNFPKRNFTNEETEAQGGISSCLRSHTEWSFRVQRLALTDALRYPQKQALHGLFKQQDLF
jgi:hypothetical protein